MKYACSSCTHTGSETLPNFIPTHLYTAYTHTCTHFILFLIHTLSSPKHTHSVKLSRSQIYFFKLTHSLSHSFSYMNTPIHIQTHIHPAQRHGTFTQVNLSKHTHTHTRTRTCKTFHYFRLCALNSALTFNLKLSFFFQVKFLSFFHEIDLERKWHRKVFYLFWCD